MIDFPSRPQAAEASRTPVHRAAEVLLYVATAVRLPIRAGSTPSGWRQGPDPDGAA